MKLVDRVVIWFGIVSLSLCALAMAVLAVHYAWRYGL